MQLTQTSSLFVPESLPWYAVHTRHDFELTVSNLFVSRNLEHFLPTYRTVTWFSGRKVVAHRPLFPGYIFCRFPTARRLPVLTTPGVLNIVGVGAHPVAIPDSQINHVRTVLQSGLATQPFPFLEEGQAIRVVSGPLQGVEGFLFQKQSTVRLVISIELLKRSISVEVDAGTLQSL